MPELPEVEVTKRGIEKSLLNHIIKDIYFDDKSLRQPFSNDLYKLKNSRVTDISRRGKYIVISTTNGYLLIHLGMTGHLLVLKNASTPRDIHDHFEITTDVGNIIRMNDIRRFGLVLYFDKDDSPYEHKPLSTLGPEPFSDQFNADYLFNKINKLKKSIKQTLMDNAVVVGVGNIYASEVLFKSRISPLRPASSISKAECQTLVDNIRIILNESIKKGGTTIRDFSGADGRLGYFVQNLFVYGHDGEKCKICGNRILVTQQGQRSTFYCPHCQK